MEGFDVQSNLDKLDRSRLNKKQKVWVKQNEQNLHSRARKFRFEGWDEAGRPVFSVDHWLGKDNQREMWALKRDADPTEIRGTVKL